MKTRTKIVSSLLLIIIIALAVFAVVVTRNKSTSFVLQECVGENCVVYLEDPGNGCFWEDGEVSGGTLVYTPPESMKTVRVSTQQVDDYLKDAEATGKCTRPA